MLVFSLFFLVFSFSFFLIVRTQSNGLKIELNVCTVVAGVAVMAVEFVIPDAYVRSHQSVAETHVAYATLEALHMIEQS